MSGRGEPDDIVQYGNDGDDDEDTASARSSGRREAPLSQHETGRAQTLRHRTRRKQWRVGRLESCGAFVCLFVCVFGRLFNCFCIDIAICIFVCMDLYLFETMFV